MNDQHEYSENRYPSVNPEQLDAIMKQAYEKFRNLQEKYPQLDAYLVYASNLGQAPLSDGPKQLIRSFPKMIVDSNNKEEAVAAVKKYDALDDQRKRTETQIAMAKMARGKLEWQKASKDSIHDVEKTIQKLIRKVTAQQKEQRETEEHIEQTTRALQFYPDVNVEIRFNTLKYDLIWELKNDPMIDQELTLQSKASIRVVMGTLISFSSDYKGTGDSL